MARLYLVSTPIGNLADVTRRAEETLGAVAVVYAEDTRRSRVLLEHLGVRTPLRSLHEHNERARAGEVLGRLDAGEDVAVVSDAGTPLVSDPGGRLLPAVLDAGHDVVPIPGASAVLTALVGAGLPVDRFTFLGFVPKKGGERAKTLERIATSAEATVVFESPERLVRLLDDLTDLCGDERIVSVGRELTKVHEEFQRGTLRAVGAHYRTRKPRGEVTVVVAADDGERPVGERDEAIIRAVAGVVLQEGLRPGDAAREVANRLGMSRNRVYDIIRTMPNSKGGEGEAGR